MTGPLQSASLGPVLEFMRELWALDHALSTRAKALGARFGITATQRLLLRIVGQTPGVSAGETARVLHLHPSTLTPVLQQLVERGLLRREVDPIDRRRAILWLTGRGERIDVASAAEVDEVVRATLARLAASEVFHARRVLHAIAEALGEPARPARRRAASSKPPPATRAPSRRRREPVAEAADDAERRPPPSSRASGS